MINAGFKFAFSRVACVQDMVDAKGEQPKSFFEQATKQLIDWYIFEQLFPYPPHQSTLRKGNDNIFFLQQLPVCTTRALIRHRNGLKKKRYERRMTTKKEMGSILYLSQIV
jgi:hypothetical protein